MSDDKIRSLERSEAASLRDLDNANSTEHELTKQLMLMGTVALALTPLFFSNKEVLTSYKDFKFLLIIFWITISTSIAVGIYCLLRDREYYLKSSILKRNVHDYINSAEYENDTQSIRDIKITELQKGLKSQTSRIPIVLQLSLLCIGYISLISFLISIVNKLAV